MTERLKNHLAGQWQAGTGSGVTLYDPVLGTPLVEVDATGLDLPHGFAFARSQAGPALRAMTYQERGAMLGKIATVLQSHRDRYYEISTANSGTVKTIPPLMLMAVSIPSQPMRGWVSSWAHAGFFLMGRLQSSAKTRSSNRNTSSHPARGSRFLSTPLTFRVGAYGRRPRRPLVHGSKRPPWATRAMTPCAWGRW